MALLREVVADLDTSFVPHDASRCAIFLTITPPGTMSCDKLVSHEIQHGNVTRPYMAHARARAPDQIQSGSDQSLHAASYPYPGLLEESELYCEELGGGLRMRINRSIHDSRDEKERNWDK